MNTCPNCGKIAGLHSSILQGCMCQYSMQAPPQRKPLTDDLYNELLFAVGNKCPNETRHQTALRYILQAEKGDEKAAHGIKENT